MNSKHTTAPWFIDTSLHIYGTGEVRPVKGQDGVTSQDFPHIGSIKCYQDAKLISAAPEMLAALEIAEQFIKTARHYFPKSVKNGDRFDLENACASIGSAIHKAKGQ